MKPDAPKQFARGIEGALVTLSSVKVAGRNASPLGDEDINCCIFLKNWPFYLPHLNFNVAYLGVVSNSQFPFTSGFTGPRRVRRGPRILVFHHSVRLS